MHNPSIQGIIILIVGIIFLLLVFVSFIVTIVYKYQQRQNAHQKVIENLKASHENELLQSQLEIQEQTFQNISREIHDSIGQKLTLAKLHLNTLRISDDAPVKEQVQDSVNMISEAINDLTDLSRSMSSEIILSHGLIKALEFEMAQLKRSGIYEIEVITTGNPVFMESSAELLLFRIAQEAINNIIKHAGASQIIIKLHYTDDSLTMIIEDNGEGFSINAGIRGTGLQNIRKRATLLKGSFNINSVAGNGTQLQITVPLYEDNPGI